MGRRRSRVKHHTLRGSHLTLNSDTFIFAPAQLFTFSMVEKITRHFHVHFFLIFTFEASITTFQYFLFFDISNEYHLTIYAYFFSRLSIPNPFSYIKLFVSRTIT